MKRSNMPIDQKASYVEPATLVDKDNPCESIMKRFDAAVVTVSYFEWAHNVTARVGASLLAIARAAKTLRIRGIYA